MTKFELKEDYRTETGEALNIFGITEKEINEVTNYHELFKNMTPAKRKLAIAAVEVYRQFSFRDKSERINSSQDAYKAMKKYMQGLEHEEAWVIFLNISNKVIRIVRVSKGGLTSTIVDSRIVLKEALLCNAVQFILVHNHPSGNTRPSSYDNTLTENISKAGKAIDIQMIDHLIFTDSAYYSYRDEGKL